MNDPEVHYTEYYYGNAENCRCYSIESFIEDNLGKHLEEKLQSLQTLVISLVKSAIVANTISIADVANLLNVNGQDFRLVEPE